MSVADLWKTMQMHGVEKGTALSMLAILGMGMNTYGPKTEWVTGSEEDRQKQFQKDLDEMKWDSKPPAYAEFLTRDQKQRVDARRQEKRKDLVFSAAGSEPVRSHYQSDETYRRGVEERGEVIEQFQRLIQEVDHSSAQRMLVEHYRRPGDDGKMKYEFERGKLKASYLERGRALAKLYGMNDEDFYNWYASFANQR